MTEENGKEEFCCIDRHAVAKPGTIYIMLKSKVVPVLN
jgi:hypothetical protein